MRAAHRIYRQVAVPVGAGATGQSTRAISRVGYYAHAPLLAVMLIAVIAARLQEVVPFFWTIRPALTFGLLGTALIIALSRTSVVASSLTHPVMRLLYALMAWAIVTAPWSLWPGRAMSAAVTVMPPILMLTFVVLSCEPNAKNLNTLKLGLIGAAALHGTLLLGMGGASADRMGSTASLDPNDLAMLMVLAFPFAVSMALNSKGVRRGVAWLAALVCLTVVVYTGSRGGTLALLAAGLVYVASQQGKRRGLALAALVFAGLLTWNLAPQTFRDRMATVTNMENDYNTFEYDGRKAIWARARGYIRENPVKGVGLLNFPYAEGNWLTAAGRRGKWSNAHNSYLQITSELGFVGAALFAGIIGAAVAAGLKLRRPNPARPDLRRGQPEFLAALAGYLAGSYFLSHAYSYAFYALVAVTVFALRVDMVTRVPDAIPQFTESAPPQRRSRGFRSLRTAHLRSR